MAAGRGDARWPADPLGARPDEPAARRARGAAPPGDLGPGRGAPTHHIAHPTAPVRSALHLSRPDRAMSVGTIPRLAAPCPWPTLRLHSSAPRSTLRVARRPSSGAP